MRSSKLTICLLSILVSLSACSSLERSDDIARHKLAAYQSTKNDVVNTIGLPRSVEKSTDGEVEFWYYTGKPISSSYFVPVPFAHTSYSPGIDLVRYADLGAKNVINNQPVVLVLTLDRTGRLLKIHHPETN